METSTSTSAPKSAKTRLDTNELYELFKSRGCEIINCDNRKAIEYLCKCGKSRTQALNDFKRRFCKTCKVNLLHEIPTDDIEGINGEIWIPIMGGYISNFGKAKSALDKDLTLDNKGRYHLDGKNQYASRIMAKAFKIDGYLNLDDKNTVVSFRDGNVNNLTIENLYIRTKNDVGRDNGKLSRQSDLFKEKMTWTLETFTDIPYVIIDELPEHRIYKNGEMWNGSRFLTFSKVENYYTVIINTIPYKVHKLVCFAFNRIEGMNAFNDYKDIEVNHINGFSNHADNLEWCTHKENMLHAYRTGLITKVRAVLQFDKDDNSVFIAEYPSIAEATRITGEPEHRISTIANNENNSKALYYWRFVNEDETEEYRRKYSVSFKKMKI